MSLSMVIAIHQWAYFTDRTPVRWMVINAGPTALHMLEFTPT
jgi:hypothetical protein